MIQGMPLLRKFGSFDHALALLLKIHARGHQHCARMIDRTAKRIVALDEKCIGLPLMEYDCLFTLRCCAG